MAIKTGKHDTLIIGVIIVVVVVFYLFLYFAGDLVIPTGGNGTSVITPQPIGVRPVTQSVGVGDTVTVDVVNENAENLYGYQFDVNYDPDVLEFQSVEEGDLLKLDGAPTYCLNYNLDNPGIVKDVVCLRLGPVGEVSGSGILSKITFISKSRGRSDIELTNVKLSDEDANALRPETSKGEVIVG